MTFIFVENNSQCANLCSVLTISYRLFMQDYFYFQSSKEKYSEKYNKKNTTMFPWMSFASMWSVIILVSMDSFANGRKVRTTSQVVQHTQSKCTVIRQSSVKLTLKNGCHLHIPNYIMCGGSCESVDGVDGLVTIDKYGNIKPWSNTCQCCTPTSQSKTKAYRNCGNGWKYISITVPESCGCQRCSDQNARKPTRSRRKKF